MQIVDKAVCELTVDEYRACYYWNKRGDGSMREYLVSYAESDEARAVIVKDDTGPLWILKGWALLTPITHEHVGSVPEDAFDKCKYFVQFYVPQAHRNQGIGSLLMQEVIKHDSNPNVQPWNRRSGKFFSRYPNIVIHDDDKKWLT